MVRFGIIGAGFMGKMHSAVYGLLSDATLVGVHDKDPEKAQAMVDQHGGKVYESADAMFTDPEIDVVSVCLPTFLHREFTERAFAAGKHVFCEKPMALNVADADAMIAAAKAAGKELMIGHCIRFWPEYVKLKSLVESGELGQLLSLNLTRYGAFPHWSSENWLADPSKAGGGVLDMHIHDTDYALYLCGDPDSMVSHGTMDERGASHVFTTMTFGPTVVQVEGGWNLPHHTPFKMTFRAIFENGAAIWEGGPLTIYRDNHDPEVVQFEAMSAAGGGNISDLGGYYRESEYFVRCLMEDKPLEVVTPQTSRRSLEVTLQEIDQIRAKG